MRLFVALDLPPPIIEALSRVAPATARGVRLVRPDQMHITLHFIGEAHIDVVQETLASVECGPCRLSVAGLGRFRIAGGRTILWAGVSETEALLELHAACARAIAAIGVRVERRRFTPHVTLARLDSCVRKKVVDDFLRSGNRRSFGEFVAESFVLYDSVTRSDGARYEAIATYPMTAANQY